MNDITITNSYISYRGSQLGTAAIGACSYNEKGGGNQSHGGNITIENCIIDAETTTGAGIGCGAKGINANVEIGDITIINSDLKIKTGTGAGIGSGEGSHAGNITIIDTDLSNVTTGGGEVVGKGVNGTCGDITIINDGRSKKISKYNPLKIHHGTKANQATNFYINDMHTKSLGIDNAKVITRQKATEAIEIIDSAIDYALNEATQIGSYLQRLEYTGVNVTTMSENVQSAESTIRDADMAKEMTEYTKSNILTQSAQSMLAQANQNLSSVLSMLQ